MNILWRSSEGHAPCLPCKAYGKAVGVPSLQKKSGEYFGF
jgi:hypothetical protein